MIDSPGGFILQIFPPLTWEHVEVLTHEQDQLQYEQILC